MIKWKYKGIYNEKKKNTILVILLCILIVLFSMFMPLKTYGEFINSKHGVAGPKYFKYNGEWLKDIRHKIGF